jgi:hypothetical protein
MLPHRVTRGKTGFLAGDPWARRDARRALRCSGPRSGRGTTADDEELRIQADKSDGADPDDSGVSAPFDRKPGLFFVLFVSLAPIRLSDGGKMATRNTRGHKKEDQSARVFRPYPFHPRHRRVSAIPRPVQYKPEAPAQAGDRLRGIRHALPVIITGCPSPRNRPCRAPPCGTPIHTVQNLPGTLSARHGDRESCGGDGGRQDGKFAFIDRVFQTSVILRTDTFDRSGVNRRRRIAQFVGRPPNSSSQQRYLPCTCV